MTDKLSEIERLHDAATPDLPLRLDNLIAWPRRNGETRRRKIMVAGDHLKDGADESLMTYVTTAANFTPVAIRVIRKLVEALERQPCRERTHAEDGGEPCIVCAALSEVKKELGM